MLPELDDTMAIQFYFMTTNQIRENYLKFFEKKGHVRIKPSPLVLESVASTLFTSAGMQQLVPYLSGKKHPKGKRLVDSQPSLRTQDIDEIGDNRHQTFFEMLGNWSLGDYFKEEQISWFWEFLTEELKLSEDKLWVSVFKGEDQVPRDDKSFEIWKKLGIPEGRIYEYGVDKNWWSMTGLPSDMTQGDIGGPDSEVFFEFTQIKHDTKYGKECHPNCDCGRFLEIGNSVFIQYVKKADGKLEELPQKNVDFGGGLERLSAAVENNPDVFQIDLSLPIIEKIEEASGKKYTGNETFMRRIADHLRAATFLIADGVKPEKEGHGSVLRRLIRKSVDSARALNIDQGALATIASEIIPLYESVYPEITKNTDRITTELSKEEMIYVQDVLTKKTLQKDEDLMKSPPVVNNPSLSGVTAYNSLASLGVPLEISLGYAKSAGTVTDERTEEEFWKGVEKEKQRHKEVSRAGAKGKFKGGLADHSEDTIKLHTATHLLHWALREALGESVHQEGSNITKERLRFDFSHKSKLTDEDVERVQSLINEKIKEDLPVNKNIEDKKQALKSGALAFFKETYPEKVSVYTIGKDPENDWISKEFCGGPHVDRTGKIGRVKITKQDKIGAGLVRIYAQLENG